MSDIYKRECRYSSPRQVPPSDLCSSLIISKLFNLTAQRDQNLSIQIAKDSRSLATSSARDSTSMKTIAAVTMIFLPGTFIATLLALPSFEWSDNQLSVRRDFWIYWAITIPLTLLTLLIWLAWSNWKTQIESQVDKNERDAVAANFPSSMVFADEDTCSENTSAGEFRERWLWFRNRSS